MKNRRINTLVTSMRHTARTTARVLMPLLAATVLSGCGADPSVIPDGSEYANMEEDSADCEFDIITFTITGGQTQEIHLNGLPTAALSGADKVDEAVWETVTRRGVRFAEILDEALVSEPDETPVNCVARDGFDPLRTKLAGDTSMLPHLSFLRDRGYVYVGDPGDKDPLYPEMEGRSLIVDYDVASDAEVPAYLGGSVASLGMFRWKMIEKLDDQQRGVIEIDPVVR